jgi:hypothetical protein
MFVRIPFQSLWERCYSGAAGTNKMAFSTLIHTIAEIANKFAIYERSGRNRFRCNNRSKFALEQDESHKNSQQDLGEYLVFIHGTPYLSFVR